MSVIQIAQNPLNVTILDGIILVLLIGIIFAVIKFYRMLQPAAKAIQYDANRYSVKEDSDYGVIVQKIIETLKGKFQSTKVVIGRFHNGGNYVNGLPMKKFTITYETSGGSAVPMMDKCVAVLNSRYSIAFAQLCTFDEFCVADINDCPDSNFRRDMKEYEYKATYLFLIRQFDGKEDGFVGINFNHTHVMPPEHRHMVIEQIPRIIGLFNMEQAAAKCKE